MVVTLRLTSFSQILGTGAFYTDCPFPSQRSAIPLRLPPVDHLHELPEEIERVVRPGRGLGVVLHGQHRLAAIPEPPHPLTVQIDVPIPHPLPGQPSPIDP